MTGRRRALDILPWMGIAGAAIGWGLSHQVGSNGIFDDCRADGADQQDQLAVRATLRIRDDMGSYHMVGPMVDVLGIQRR